MDKVNDPYVGMSLLLQKTFELAGLSNMHGLRHHYAQTHIRH
ncbi:hypothetical protein ABK905_01955 [Acerihabitans sp. KWT182]|uniref:Uncharacterized protein n=1 Tax=Acerihabitans sp. KWT182 TaxID=3157919 RepID=A0AAU7QAB8_9GAMM